MRSSRRFGVSAFIDGDRYRIQRARNYNWGACGLVWFVVSLLRTVHGLQTGPTTTPPVAVDVDLNAPSSFRANGIDADSKRDANEPIAFDVIAGHVANCLIRSDLKRKGSNDGASSGWTSWIDQPSEFRLRQCLKATVFDDDDDDDDENHNIFLQRQRWMRWMKSSPVPVVLDLTERFRMAADRYVTDVDLASIDTTRSVLTSRIGCRLICLTSGTTMERPLRTPAGGMVYGKLLYGGVTRYRLLPGRSRRRTGERTVLPATASSGKQNEDFWCQYGGPERNYEALDIGPAAVLELVLLPSGLSIEEDDDNPINDSLMGLTDVPWELASSLLEFRDEDKDEDEDDDHNGEMSGDAVGPSGPPSLSAAQRNRIYESSLRSRVGGMESQIESVVRRVLDGRQLSFDGDAEELRALGLTPVRGLLLYGPPGCGKTTLAREIVRSLSYDSSSLDDEQPHNNILVRMISAPELLDRWVGGSERKVRELFRVVDDGSEEGKKVEVLVVVIDEIDAVFRKRTGGEDSAEVTRNSVVNQILAIMDGVGVIDNNSHSNNNNKRRVVDTDVLVIGMTNRRHLLDEALLRPGRLEVQLEVPLPDAEGRRQILDICTASLRRRGRLSGPLVKSLDEGRLSSDGLTGGFSGADLAGVVRSAGSLALSRIRQTEGSSLDELVITLEDVAVALDEVQREQNLGSHGPTGKALGRFGWWWRRMRRKRRNRDSSNTRDLLRKL